MNHTTKLLAATALVSASAASAADLEVTHWWTSGGEAAAVGEFAKAFNEKTDHSWVIQLAHERALASARLLGHDAESGSSGLLAPAPDRGGPR